MTTLHAVPQLDALTEASTESTESEAPRSDTFRIAVTRADMEPYMVLVQQVVSRVLRRLPSNVGRDDLVAAGSYGLMDALRRSPGERGEQFEAYARIRIRGAVIDELRTQDWLGRSARAHANAQAVEGDHATSSTIIGIEDLPEAQRTIASVDASPFDLVARRSERDALGRAVSALPEREAQIVDLHYFQGVQFHDIAEKMKVSRARVSQLHSRALKMLRPLLLADREEESAA
jgi:RNA polymerase sigma factor for flagellar operon FliA